MNNKSRKAMKPCFGSKEFSKLSSICKNCQHKKHCAKIRRIKAGEVLVLHVNKGGTELLPIFNRKLSNTCKSNISVTESVRGNILLFLPIKKTIIKFPKGIIITPS